MGRCCATSSESRPIVSAERAAATDDSAHVAAVAENLDGLTVFFHEWRALDGETLEKVREQRERYTRLVSEIVARGIEPATSARRTCASPRSVIGMCNWLCQWYRPVGVCHRLRSAPTSPTWCWVA